MSFFDIFNVFWSLCIFTSCVSFCCCCCRCVICYWLYLLVDYGSILSHISRILYMYNTLTFFICCLIPVLYFYDCILYSFYARKIWNFHNKVQNIKNIEKGHLMSRYYTYIVFLIYDSKWTRNQPINKVNSILHIYSNNNKKKHMK
jgi:hypothetical protein